MVIHSQLLKSLVINKMQKFTKKRKNQSFFPYFNTTKDILSSIKKFGLSSCFMLFIIKLLVTILSSTKTSFKLEYLLALTTFKVFLLINVNYI